MARSPARRNILSPRPAPEPSCSNLSSRLDELAASCTPPAHVERLAGSELDPPLVRALVDVTRRNMRDFAGATWNEREKRSELCHRETRVVAVRAKAQLLGFIAYRHVEEEGVPVAYVYELQLEPYARGMRLGSALLDEVGASARRHSPCAGLMLTVHTQNEAARRFYGRIGFEASPISPALCAPPHIAASCDYEILQQLWDDSARRMLIKKGADARRHNFAAAVEAGEVRVTLVMRKGRSRPSPSEDSEGGSDGSRGGKRRRKGGLNRADVDPTTQ